MELHLSREEALMLQSLVRQEHRRRRKQRDKLSGDFSGRDDEADPYQLNHKLAVLARAYRKLADMTVFGLDFLEEIEDA